MFDTNDRCSILDGTVEAVLADLQRTLKRLGIAFVTAYYVVHTQESVRMLDLRFEGCPPYDN